MEVETNTLHQWPLKIPSNMDKTKNILENANISLPFADVQLKYNWILTGKIIGRSKILDWMKIFLLDFVI